MDLNRLSISTMSAKVHNMTDAKPITLSSFAWRATKSGFIFLVVVFGLTFLAVCLDRGVDNIPPMPRFEELLPYIVLCLTLGVVSGVLEHASNVVEDPDDQQQIPTIIRCMAYLHVVEIFAGAVGVAGAVVGFAYFQLFLQHSSDIRIATSLSWLVGAPGVLATARSSYAICGFIYGLPIGVVLGAIIQVPSIRARFLKRES